MKKKNKTNLQWLSWIINFFATILSITIFSVFSKILFLVKTEKKQCLPNSVILLPFNAMHLIIRKSQVSDHIQSLKRVISFSDSCIYTQTDLKEE